jgi:hypothetical protein
MHRITAINSDQPFFICYVPGAAPHDPTPEWVMTMGSPEWVASASLGAGIVIVLIYGVWLNRLLSRRADLTHSRVV